MPKLSQPKAPLGVSANKGVNMLLYYTMWGLSEGAPPYVAIHKGQQMEFRKLQDARDFAANNGYSGIHITTR